MSPEQVITEIVINEKATLLRWLLVIPLRLELRTHTLKVYCSTN